MTHNDIYTKFMIEYDKANVTSSYPSLTKYEVATLLDKAYLTLIARKLTGNNTRRAPFEYDTKAVEDLRPLLTTGNYFPSQDKKNVVSDNEFVYDIPADMLYYIKGHMNYFVDVLNPADKTPHGKLNVKTIHHLLADKFRSTATNMPWIPEPVSFMEEDGVHVLMDPYKIFLFNYNEYNLPQLAITYIKTPAKFANPVEWPKEQEEPTNQGGSGQSGSGQQAEGTWDGIPTELLYTETNSLQLHITYKRGVYTTDNVKYALNDSSLKQFVTLTEDGLLTVKDAATDLTNIAIKASVLGDSTTFIVRCKYMPAKQEPGKSYIRIERGGDNDTHVIVNVYVTAAEDCYLGILKLNSTTDLNPKNFEYAVNSVYKIEEGNSNRSISLSIPRLDKDYYIRAALYKDQQFGTLIANSGDNIIKINKLEATPTPDPQEPSNQYQPFLGSTFMIGESKLGEIVVVVYNAPRRI